MNKTLLESILSHLFLELRDKYNKKLENDYINNIKVSKNKNIKDIFGNFMKITEFTIDEVKALIEI